MCDVYIEGVLSGPDLAAAAAEVASAFHRVGIGAVAQEIRCRRQEGSGFTCEVRVSPTPTLHLVPCRQRGTHLNLTECWACWSDVVRGSILEGDVLAPGYPISDAATPPPPSVRPVEREDER